VNIKNYLEKLFLEENGNLSFYYTSGNTKFRNDIFISKSKNNDMTDNHLHIFYKGNKNKIEYKQKDIRGTTI
jgi:hypothetical protein